MIWLLFFLKKIARKSKGEGDVLFTDNKKSKTKLVSKASLPLAPAKAVVSTSSTTASSSATPSAASSAGRNAAEFSYIANEEHYSKVIERIKEVKHTLWIGTADIKDLYVKDGRGTKPLLEVLSDLAKKGVAIRLKRMDGKFL